MPTDTFRQLDPAAALFHSLSDPTRLGIVKRMADGEVRVGDLSGELGLAQSTVSAHVACLRECGLVEGRAQGRSVYYSLSRPELMDMLAQADVLVDARSIAEFSGKENGGARSGGHVPGARSFPWDRLSGDVATFKGAEPMQRALRQAGILPGKEIVVYCNGGLGRSTHLLAALTLLGYDKVKVYPGSWIEWASDPARSVAR